MKASVSLPGFPALLQDFFCQRLIAQRNASTCTIAAYRDTFRLLFKYVEKRSRKAPTTLTMADFDAALVLGFLDHLEKDRKNTIRTRNARYAAIRSFLKYAATRDPVSLPVIQRVLAIPMKRFERPILGFLSREEMDALLEAPDGSSWNGQRDRVMLATFYNTGARVSEIVALRRGDVLLEKAASLTLHGKGRKQRTIPLWKKTALLIKAWIARLPPGTNDPLFPNCLGNPLTRSGVASRLKVAVKTATRRCPSLAKRPISPHTLRHTTAMHLLQAGVDLSVIALWLGHESPTTTHMYVEADLTMKERALKKVREPTTGRLRFRATDKMLQFLESL